MIELVKCKYGYLKGVKSNAGFSLFRGVPYAKAPIGELRWKAPQELEPWNGIKVCDTYGPACVQYDRWANCIDDITDDSNHPYIMVDNYPYPPKMSEDCLYLNIYTPAESENDCLPVCFYIHGGGLQQWYGSDYEYCGDEFCKNGCIVVNITYRLNVFGYFAHPELDKENEFNSSGNYGLLDQIHALKWVYENIEYFGGDKNRIMCFGQSAGGGSSLALLASKLSSNYVGRVSLQSAIGLNNLMKEKTKQQIEEKGIQFMKECGCENITQMRQLDANFLRDKNDELFGMFGGFGMNIDGYVLEDEPTRLLAENKLKDVEIIIGCTADEGANNKKPMFGVNLCANIVALCKKLSESKHKPIYSYVFTREQPGDDVGVPHSCDNRYQFNSLAGCWRPYTDKDYELARNMNKYWANFARNGNPNDEGLSEWSPFTSKEPLQMKFDIDECEMHDFNADTNGNIEKLSTKLLEEYGR
ncbi:MAG: carboxylesterase family protein [Erysipelotrichaceae bacterium]|nr:carboxylesterase family protein [Erysipelotrichaceae bacterium]